MASAYSHDAHEAHLAPNSRHGKAGAQRDIRPESQVQRLNMKALRLAVHGWWLGNPLIYKPGVAELASVARKLAGAGVASGALVLSDMPVESAPPADGGGSAVLNAAAVPGDEAGAVHVVLIVRPPVAMAHASGVALGATAAEAIAEVAQGTLGRLCAVHSRWQVVIREGGRIGSRFASVAVEHDEGAALIEMRLSLDHLWRMAQDGSGQPSTALFARSDWREVFLARALHTLDGRLRAVYGV